MINVRIKRASPDVVLPAYKMAGSAGCDVCSNENVTIPARGKVLVHTGLFLEVPEGYECQCRPRSGLALMSGVTVLNSPGTIDSDYRGEMMVLLYNSSDCDQYIVKGQRICQFVFAPVTLAKFEEVDELSRTQRNTGGWGSTGA